MEEVFEVVIDNISKKMEGNINEGDYVIDGLLYCCRCNTKKQTVVNFMGKQKVVNCLCKCKADELKREEEERQQAMMNLRIEKLRVMGFPESEMSKWTFANDDHTNEKITQIAKNYVENFEQMKQRGKGLLFYGTVGTGKSYISACIANALIDKGYPCLMTNFARLVNTISGMYDGKQQYIDNLNKYPLLIIDDLASERDTEYMNEIVQNIIDSRYRSGLPTIITTNLSGEEIKNPVDIRKQRTYSRLLEMCIPIEVKGTDRRREKLKDDYKEFSGLLGL